MQEDNINYVQFKGQTKREIVPVLPIRDSTLVAWTSMFLYFYTLVTIFLFVSYLLDSFTCRVVHFTLFFGECAAIYESFSTTEPGTGSFECLCC